MDIIIHRTTGKESDEAFRHLVYELQNVIGLHEIKLRHEKQTIDIGDIHIEFRFGDVFRMAGFRPDYYNTDSHPASDFLWQSATKCNGKELDTIDDVYDVVVKEYRKLRSKDIDERYKTCGRCAHDGDDPDIPESPCYMCRRNIFDRRIDRFEERKEK